MATSGTAIKTAILNRLKAKPHWTHIADDLHQEMEEFIEGIAEGVYDELQNLSDTAGSPPSSSHQ
ncbi:MAG: hypothetical protein HY096_09630 [Nitrospinae bacterium]|nr:hypothetical protein [Nitrospinota bacterium]